MTAHLLDPDSRQLVRQLLAGKTTKVSAIDLQQHIHTLRDIIIACLQADKTVHLDFTDDKLTTAILSAVSEQGYGGYLQHDLDQSIKLTEIARLRALLKRKDVIIPPPPLSTFQPLLSAISQYFSQAYSPIFGKQSWWKINRMSDQADPAMCINVDVDPHQMQGTQQEYWRLKGSVDRLSRLWSPDYAALDELELWHPDLSRDVATTYRKLARFSEELLSIINNLYESQASLRRRWHQRRHDDLLALQALHELLVKDASGSATDTGGFWSKKANSQPVAPPELLDRYNKLTGSNTPSTTTIDSLSRLIANDVSTWKEQTSKIVAGELRRANKLNSDHDHLQAIDQSIRCLYEEINDSKIFAFTVENAAHYVAAQLSYAESVLRRITIALQIIDTNSGYLLWYASQQNLDHIERKLVNRLCQYPSEEWVYRMEVWYLRVLQEIYHPEREEVSAKDMQAVYQLAQQEASTSSVSWTEQQDCSIAAALLSLRQDDKKLCNRLLKETSDGPTPAELFTLAPALAKSIWPLTAGHQGPSKTDITITDSAPDTDRQYLVITKDDSDDPLTLDLIAALPLGQTPVGQRLAIGRAISQHIDRHAGNLRLFVLKDQYVISLLDDIDNREVLKARRDTLIKEISLGSRPQDTLTDYILADDITTHIWLPAAVLCPDDQQSLLHQCYVLDQLDRAGLKTVYRSQLLPRPRRETSTDQHPITSTQTA